MGVGCRGRYKRRALIGQSMVLLAAILTVTPSLKGSVLDALIHSQAPSLVMARSCFISVIEGSKDVFRGEVYSDILKNPKNAVVMAAQSIILS